MVYDALKSEIIGLPDDKLEQLIDFARFLKQSMSEGTGRASSETQGGVRAFSHTETPVAKREIGFMAEDFVSISPDFDTCLEGMEEYV